VQLFAREFSWTNGEQKGKKGNATGRCTANAGFQFGGYFHNVFMCNKYLNCFHYINKKLFWHDIYFILLCHRYISQILSSKIHVNPSFPVLLMPKTFYPIKTSQSANYCKKEVNAPWVCFDGISP
jgi:hypothetical protein